MALKFRPDWSVPLPIPQNKVSVLGKIAAMASSGFNLNYAHITYINKPTTNGLKKLLFYCRSAIMVYSQAKSCDFDATALLSDRK
jgi:hypothetical protein